MLQWHYKAHQGMNNNPEQLSGKDIAGNVHSDTLTKRVW